MTTTPHFTTDPNWSVDLRVEAYLWGAPTDLDSINGSVEHSSTSLAFVKVGTGAYETTYIVQMDDIADRYLHLRVAGAVGDYVETDTKTVYFPDEPGEELPDFSVGLYIANYAEVAREYLQGERVEFEGYTTRGGHDVDVGPINFSMSAYQGYERFQRAPGVPLRTELLTAAQLTTGRFRANFTVPDMPTTMTYQFRASVGEGSTLVGRNVTIQVHPVPVLLYVTNSTNASAEAVVLVGNASGPIARASVTFEADLGPAYQFPHYRHVVPATVAVETDAKGFASARLDYNFSDRGDSMVLATVRWHGLTTTQGIFVHRNDPCPDECDPGWPYAGDSEFWLNYTGGVVYGRPGTVVAFSFEVLGDGIPMPNETLATLLIAEGREGALAWGNTTTDDRGRFTIDYPVPLSGAPWYPIVMVWNKNGARAGYTVLLYPYNFQSSKLLQINATGGSVGEPVHIEASYRGSPIAPNASAFYYVLPGDFGDSYRVAAFPREVEMNRSGSSFSADATLPEWWPGGNYTVVVDLIQWWGETADDDYFIDNNRTVIHLAPSARVYELPPLPPPPPIETTSKSFIPGLGPFAVVAVSLAAALVGARRRGR